VSRIDDIKQYIEEERPDRWTMHSGDLAMHEDIEYLLSLVNKYKIALDHCIELGECQLDYGGSMDSLAQVVEVASSALKE
jgi:hypothetical protein